MRASLKYALLFLILLMLSSVPLAFQLRRTSIEGFITDQLGPLSNATVEARDIISGATFQAVSDVSGRYEIDDLRPARYSLRVQAPGHDSMWIARLVVEAGQTAHEDVFLSRNSMPTGF
jgi:hypothetical protein